MDNVRSLSAVVIASAGFFCMTLSSIAQEVELLPQPTQRIQLSPEFVAANPSQTSLFKGGNIQSSNCRCSTEHRSGGYSRCRVGWGNHR